MRSIKNAGGITIRVNRGPNPEWYDAAVQYNKGNKHAKSILEEYNIHASEYSSVGLDYDYYVDNSGTVDELHRKIDSIINL